MRLLKRGSRGEQVIELQKGLHSLGLYFAKQDGIFGRITERAVKAFQIQNTLLVDGIVGPQTWASIFRTPSLGSQEGCSICTDTLWERFQSFVETMRTPVVYGPGRGLFDKNWVVTWGPISRGQKSWPIKKGKSRGPSLHCSSLTNFLLGYLLNYNEKWTHCGNRPLLEQLCTNDSSLHAQPRGGGAKWRGYAECIGRLASDGDTQLRTEHRLRNASKYLDAYEIWERRSELSTFNFFSQSDKKSNRWNLDHHTGVLVYDAQNDQLFRLAADGYRSKKSPRQYSATPVSYKELKAIWRKADTGKLYQLFRLHPESAPEFAKKAQAASIDIEI